MKFASTLAAMGALLLTSCGPDGTNAPDAAIGDARSAATSPGDNSIAFSDADPALWLLSDEDTKIYIFGSVHYLPAGLAWFDEDVRDAFDDADTLVLEMVAPPTTELMLLMSQMGMAQDGIALRDRLDDDLRLRYEALLRKLGQPAAAFDAYEPWLAFMTIYQLLLQDEGFDANEGVETKLNLAAKKSGKKIAGLETAKEQFSIFDDLPQEDGIDLLRTVVENPDEVGVQLHDIVGHWSKGDIAALDTYLTKTSEGNAAEHALLTKRNENWVEWLQQRLDTPGTIFLTVGAAHLAGPQNVRMLLAEHGLNAERIEY